MPIKPLHICIVTGDFPALTETFITNKVLELRKRGHEITIIKNSNSGTNKSHEDLVKKSGVEVLKFPSVSSVMDLIKSPSLLNSFSSSKQQFKSNLQLSLLQKHKYDIIHFEFSGLAIAYKEAIKKASAKTVVSCRGTAEKVKPLSDINRKKDLQEVFSIVNKIHCVSEDMSESIKTLGANQNKIFVNRPSIDADLFKRSIPYKINNDKPFSILSIGRLTFQKGYLPGLLAMKRMKENGRNFKWKIIGEGPQLEEIIFHIDALCLTGNVELLGAKNRNEILELYQTTDAFFLPSVYEGIANVCLEALAMELPLVSTRSGGMEEVIDHEVNGLLCDVYDAEAMATQLESLAADVELPKRLGENARETIIKDFTLARQIDVFEEEYNLLVNANNS
jgi:colanic acid/amylovoran biosynthesis glycosyltransferase